MQVKFIDPEVVLFILLCVGVALAVFVGRDAEAATLDTSVQVVIPVSVGVTAEVSCNPTNCPEIPESSPVVIQNVETSSLWERFVKFIRSYGRG
jgi:hypothetical protein